MKYKSLLWNTWLKSSVVPTRDGRLVSGERSLCRWWSLFRKKQRDGIPPELFLCSKNPYRGWRCRKRDSCPWCWFRDRVFEVFKRLRNLRNNSVIVKVSLRTTRKIMPGRSGRSTWKIVQSHIEKKARRLGLNEGAAVWVGLVQSDRGSAVEIRWLVVQTAEVGKNVPTRLLVRASAQFGAYDGRFAVASLKQSGLFNGKKRVRFFRKLRSAAHRLNDFGQ